MTDKQYTTTPNNLPNYKIFETKTSGNSVEKKVGDKNHASKNNTEKSSSSSSSSSSNSSSSSGEKGKESNSNSSTTTDNVSNTQSKPDNEKQRQHKRNKHNEKVVEVNEQKNTKPNTRSTIAKLNAAAKQIDLTAEQQVTATTESTSNMDTSSSPSNPPDTNVSTPLTTFSSSNTEVLETVNEDEVMQEEVRENESPHPPEDMTGKGDNNQ